MVVVLERLKSKLDESESLYETAKQNHDQIRSGSEIFDESSPEVQRIAARSLISAVRLNRGYQIEVDFNFSVKELVENISFDDENISVSVESVEGG